MKSRNKDTLRELIVEMPADLQLRTKLSVLIANKIESLMHEAGYSKKQFAEKLGRRPSEVTKWLSGEHNFTIATLAMLGTFFGEPIIYVPSSDESNQSLLQDADN